MIDREEALMSLKINRFPKGPLGENTYLIEDEATGCMAVIDPGYFGEDIINMIPDRNSLKYILLTHGHYDHYACIREYTEAYPCARYAVPAGEDYLLHSSRDNKMIAGGRDTWESPEADIKLDDGSVLTLGETELRIIATPGHTEGGICFVTDREVFTGDTLFRLSVGNTSFETGSWSSLTDSIKNKLYTLQDDVRVYPGHGDETTIGYEKKANPFV